MGYLSYDRNPLVFRRGWFAPNGLPAYLVEDETDPDEPLGIVWHEKGRGQRDGDWAWEADGLYGLSPNFQRYMTREQAAKALVDRVREAIDERSAR